MNNSVLKIVGGALLVAASLVSAPAMAYSAKPLPSTTSFDVAILPPGGMIMFCKSNASHCRADDVAKVTLTDELLAALNSVNTRVNSAISPRNDVGRDKWTVGASSGDCEDYALTKRAQLIRMGVPAGALRLATTTTRRGEPHAILVVKTSGGDYVLDNLSSSVKRLGSSGYRIRKISTQNPMVWAAG